MKKIIFFSLLLFCSKQMVAQSGNKAIDNSIIQFNESIKAGNYYQAILKLEQSKNIVDSILGNQVAEALPKEIGDWVVQQSNEASNSPMQMNTMTAPNAGGIVNITRFYKNKYDKEKAPEMGTLEDHGADGGMMPKMLFVTVSNNMMELATFVNTYSDVGGKSNPGGQYGMELKSLRIKNYRAVLTNNPSMKNVELSVIVGSSIIKISGAQLADNALIEKLANAIDFEKIKSILGE